MSITYRFRRFVNLYKVFIHLASLAARQRLIYRISGFILFAATLMEISALVFFWRVAQGESMDEAILGPQGITGYIILAGLLGAANIGFGDQQMGKAVRSGEVVRHFLQPLDIQMTMLAREIGGWMGAALLTTIPVLLLSSIIIGTPRPAGAIPLLAFIISWLLGAATIAAFDYCVGLLTFRTVQDFFISQAKVAIVAFFSGALIPLAYLPDILKLIAEFLPFQQAVYIPAAIYLGIIPLDAILKALLIQIGWFVFLILLGRLGWRWTVQDVALHAT